MRTDFIHNENEILAFLQLCMKGNLYGIKDLY